MPTERNYIFYPWLSIEVAQASSHQLDPGLGSSFKYRAESSLSFMYVCVIACVVGLDQRSYST